MAGTKESANSGLLQRYINSGLQKRYLEENDEEAYKQKSIEEKLNLLRTFKNDNKLTLKKSNTTKKESKQIKQIKQINDSINNIEKILKSENINISAKDLLDTINKLHALIDSIEDAKKIAIQKRKDEIQAEINRLTGELNEL